MLFRVPGETVTKSFSPTSIQSYFNGSTPTPHHFTNSAPTFDNFSGPTLTPDNFSSPTQAPYNSKISTLTRTTINQMLRDFLPL